MIAPDYATVDAQYLAPFYSNVEALAPENSFPDFSVEAYQFNNYAQFNTSVDISSPRKYASSTDIVESNVYDNKSNYGEFDWGFVNYGVHFACRQIQSMLHS